MARIRWDKELEDSLMLWKSLGWTNKDIAIELGGTIAAIKCKFRDITNPNYSPELRASRAHKWQSENLEYLKNYRKRYRIDNRARLSKYSREYAIKTDRQYQKKWEASNKGQRSSYSAKRRAIKLKATPKWADLYKIKCFYDSRPEGYHVDHIVPLQGERVCGLHVLENLQYLTAAENLSKGNKFNQEEI